MFNTFTERKESLRNTATTDVNNNQFVRVVRKPQFESERLRTLSLHIISDALGIWALLIRFERKMATAAKAVRRMISI